jgi:hypothetical protein
MKQWTLKPQDLLISLKIAVNPSRSFVLAELADELLIAISQVHSSVVRAEQARLISRASGQLKISPENLREFVLFGAKYCFPGQLGPVGQGVPTAVAAPPLNKYLEQHEMLAPVWPSVEGEVRGPMLCPLHPSVPTAVRTDPGLYEVLALFDALRIGAARERKLAVSELEKAL